MRHKHAILCSDECGHSWQKNQTSCSKRAISSEHLDAIWLYQMMKYFLKSKSPRSLDKSVQSCSPIKTTMSDFFYALLFFWRPVVMVLFFKKRWEERERAQETRGSILVGSAKSLKKIKKRICKKPERTNPLGNPKNQEGPPSLKTKKNKK